ncbi:uncharacterized protein LOC131317241 [Rhododendron vialii]|uniref:uncharacterized protein LOC131317241 n=1 Tax=Rhododendron vialii TaxID=182163 RepID=UPI00265F9D19|nr:uncharacterized protein LOC131317241 [Rhododendron vialii]
MLFSSFVAKACTTLWADAIEWWTFLPPEPLPWDRKDFFKERKQQQHERPSLNASPWRRPRRRLLSVGIVRVSQQTSGSCNQGWHLYSEESGHGFTRSQSNEKIVDESSRPSDTRADGKYSRSGRENRGSFSQKDQKCHSRKNGESPNGLSRPLDVSDQRDLRVKIRWDRLIGSLLNGPDRRVCAPGGSGLSNSSSSKSMGVDSSEARAEAQMGNVTPVQSPSGDVVAFATSAVAPSEETSAKKRPRLGWGEGLAKYEKKKVDGPDDIAANNEAGYCGRTEPLQLQV